MSQDLSVDFIKQSVNSGYLEFFELEVGKSSTDPATNILYFHAGTNGSMQDVTYDSKTYVAIPIFMSGIEMKGDGPLARPSLTIANVEALIKSGSKFKSQMQDGTWNATVGETDVTHVNFELDDLIGSRITRRRTLEKYLNSSPTIEFKKDVFIIDRIEARDNTLVSFELAAAFDLEKIKIPSRIVVGKYCNWEYQGASTENALDKRRGGCVWKKQNQIVHADESKSSIFVTADDEPLILKSAVEGSTGYAAIADSSSPGTHALNVFVKDNTTGLYFRSRSASNNNALFNANGTVNNVFWQLCRVYTVYSSDGSGTNYTTDASDSRKNSYVFHTDTVWRALIPNQKSDNITPENGSSYWNRGDVCGKLLQSCKMRYQAIGSTSATGQNLLPSDLLDTSKILPFGAFPGSRKFR